jgi:hypothetical protein
MLRSPNKRKMSASKRGKAHSFKDIEVLIKIPYRKPDDYSNATTSSYWLSCWTNNLARYFVESDLFGAPQNVFRFCEVSTRSRHKSLDYPISAICSSFPV